MSFQKKYLKYKNKYLDLKNQIGGSNPNSPRASAGGGGSNPNSPRVRTVDSDLIDYIREGNVEKVKALIERGINVNEKLDLNIDLNVGDSIYESKGMTPLMIATLFGQEPVVEALIVYGKVNVNLESDYYYTAFMFACQENRTYIAKFLIKNGANINITRDRGMTGLMIVCRENLTDIAKFLIEKGADMNIITIGRRMTALMYACDAENKEIVDALLATRSVNVNLQSIRNETALILASKKGNTHIVNALINAGANVNLQDRAKDNYYFLGDEIEDEEPYLHVIQNNLQVGFTALMYAIELGYKETAISLIRANRADLNIHNWKNVTALRLACEYGHNDILKALLDRGANVNVPFNVKSPIIIAVEKRKIDILVTLLAYRPDLVDIIDFIGDYTGLIYAVNTSDIELIKLLITHNSNINLQDRNGYSALIHAVKKNDINLVKFLITHKANVNLQDGRGYSALMYASMNNNQELVLELLDNHANTDLKSNDNSSALDLATNPDIIRLLRTYEKGLAIYALLEELNIGNRLDIPDIKEFIAHVYNEFSPIIRDLNDAIAFINNQDYKIDDIFKLEPTFINIQTGDLGKEFDKTLDDFRRERNGYNLNKLLKISLLQLVLETRYDNPPPSHNELINEADRYVGGQVDIPNVRDFLASVYEPFDAAISFINDKNNTISDLFTLDTSLITTQNNSRYLDKVFNDALRDYKKEQNEYKLNKLFKISLLQSILDGRNTYPPPSQGEMIQNVNRYVNSRIQFM